MSRAIFALLVLAVCLPGCTKDHSTQSTCTNCPAISFKTDIIPIFTQNCATAGCHTGPNPEGHLNLDSSVAYTQALAVGKGYINPNNPGQSILYQQMLVGGTPIMPPTGALDPCTTHKIYCWIIQGATNN